MHIYTRFHKLLRTDSRVKVSGLNATIIGKSIIEITAGSHDKDMLQTGAILDVQESASVEDVIAEATLILNVIKTMILDVSNVISAVDAEKIASTVDSFNQMAANIKLYSQRMSSGQGTLGALVYDDDMQKNIFQSIANLKQTTEDLKNLLQLLKSDAREVPVVLKNINSVLGETEKTIQATQRIWPISSAMAEKDAKNNAINPMPAND